MTDLTAWLDEREREAKAGLHVCLDPDTAMRVLRALRAARDAYAMICREVSRDSGVLLGTTTESRELRDALDALPGAKP